MNGTCSCGEIKVTIPSGLKVGVCHCIDCRKATGSTHGASMTAQRRDFKLIGEPKVYTKIGSSGKQIRRYFCGTCGSPIYVDCRMEAEGKEEEDSTVHVKLGLFPVGSIPKPSSYVFAKDMEEWESPVEGAEVHQTQ